MTVKLYKEIQGKEFCVEYSVLPFKQHDGCYITWVATCNNKPGDVPFNIQWSSWNTFPEFRIIQGMDNVKGDIEEFMKSHGIVVGVFYEFFYEIGYGNYVFPGFYFKDPKGNKKSKRN